MRQVRRGLQIGQIVPIRGSAPADPVVPADAVTASGSGLDPHISLAYADIQVNRVAKARGVSRRRSARVVADHTDGRFLGFFGEPTVNVLELNLALDRTVSSDASRFRHQAAFA